MIANNEMQLKALLKDLSSKYGITPQATLQMYCLERLLDRIAASRFRKHFVLDCFYSWNREPLYDGHRRDRKGL